MQYNNHKIERKVAVAKFKNKVTQDTALKNFWRDNQHFADLFNAVLFNGKEVLKAEDLEGLVSDYKMNLIQVRKSEQFPFKNEDVNTVFDIVRKIYNEEYTKLTDIYKEKTISAELGVIIGSIVESKQLINEASKIKEKGSELNMCKSLEKLMNKSKEEGKIEGEQEGKVQGIVLTCQKFKISQEETLKNLIEEFSFSEEEANNYMKKYW